MLKNFNLLYENVMNENAWIDQAKRTFGGYMDDTRNRNDKEVIKTLESAINSNSDKLIKELATRKNINVKLQKDGWTPLMVACRLGQVETVEELLKIDNIDVNLKDDVEGTFSLMRQPDSFYLDTALMIAIKSIHFFMLNKERQKKIIQMLLNYPKIDLSIKNSKGETAYDLAVKLNDKQILAMFKNKK